MPLLFHHCLCHTCANALWFGSECRNLKLAEFAAILPRHPLTTHVRTIYPIAHRLLPYPSDIMIHVLQCYHISPVAKETWSAGNSMTGDQLQERSFPQELIQHFLHVKSDIQGFHVLHIVEQPLPFRVNDSKVPLQEGSKPIVFCRPSTPPAVLYSLYIVARFLVLCSFPGLYTSLFLFPELNIRGVCAPLQNF